MHRRLFFGSFVLVSLAVACASESPGAEALGKPAATTEATQPQPPTDKVEPVVMVDAEAPAADKSLACASTFGAALTNAFARFDGTVTAVVPPAHPTCALPNRDHLVLQAKMGGDVYRLVVNVLSDIDDPKVRFGTLDHALAGPAWSEGWHTDAPLDYVSDLGLHKDDGTMTPVEMGALVERVTSYIDVGAHVSVYSTSSGGASAHLVHRNKPGKDGAIVVGADTAHPKFLVFSFSNQAF